ncbi:hypothetical protein GCM10010345_85950 [Streptomyces canarius]|uniref:Uncharacterized protein n=1 Tax=Streptomyces canarius TaxID=285453 RepID=A0ABQ3D9K2_9ACTN|nr:hypothetical protein GCM10010345_85950 [Streptomyces canarius]
MPIRVLLPGDQEVVAHLWSRRQVPDGWRYEVGLPTHRNGPGDSVEPAEYRVWVRAPERVRPVDGVSYDAVPHRVPGAALARPGGAGPRRPSGWVLAKVGGRGPGRHGVVHAVDCEEAPAGAPVLPLERALDAAGEVGPGRGSGLSTGPFPRSRFPNRACDLAPHPALHKPRGLRGGCSHPVASQGVGIVRPR